MLLKMMAMSAALSYALMTELIQFLCPVSFALKASLIAVTVTQPVGRSSCMPMRNKDGTDIMHRSVWPRVSYDVPTICSAARFAHQT